ncbi:hypothetical protein OIE68_36660 [Nocardia vinacea]|uniref:Uncharacterized protein n=1 Tax=Nocardia vinacea TaxID=96468 RepID=A0ABZ1Z6E2_9NOCA|nr:hypothetical protein OIE68_36660 [Nocardia vinacea]
MPAVSGDGWPCSVRGVSSHGGGASKSPVGGIPGRSLVGGCGGAAGEYGCAAAWFGGGGRSGRDDW